MIKVTRNNIYTITTSSSPQDLAAQLVQLPDTARLEDVESEELHPMAERHWRFTFIDPLSP